jgi:hypothetical protein
VVNDGIVDDAGAVARASGYRLCKHEGRRAKLAAGNIDHCLALAPTSGVFAVVAGGCVLVGFSPADF